MRIEDHWIDCSVYRIIFEVKDKSKKVSKTIIVESSYCDSDVEKLIKSKFNNAGKIDIIEFVDDALLTKYCEFLKEQL